MIWVGVLDKPCVVTASDKLVTAAGALSIARLCTTDAATASSRSRRSRSFSPRRIISIRFSRDPCAHDPWVGDMPIPEKTCTHGTFFVLERSVAVSSPDHGGQVSVSPFSRFHSVVSPLESVIASCIYFNH